MGTRTTLFRRPTTLVVAIGVLILGAMVAGVAFIDPTPSARAVEPGDSVSDTGGGTTGGSD
ncbi:MAG: hypothetical protein KDB24_02315, partial [Microthrixaceae bacterium]|nr:hypothetical protein [Microthrixaceae bacterium]